MKRIIAIFIAVAFGAILAACGGNAQAADYVYRASPNVGVGTGEIIKIRKQGTGYLEATTTAGQVFANWAYDPAGVLFNKIAADNPQAIVNGYTLYFMVKAVTAVCVSQNTTIYWPYSPTPESVNDGCQIAYQNATNGK